MSASALLMIRPSAFGYNPETADSNVFQQKTDLTSETLQQKALAEFEMLNKKLSEAGIKVYVFDDLNSETPDSVFPNNWVSFHNDGTVVLYPMLSPARRKERRTDILESLRENYKISRIIDLSVYEDENRYLEGTGSIVFDHKFKTAFAALSPRTDKDLFTELCDELGYEPVWFTANDRHGVPLYHTNVMMSVAENIAIICADSINDNLEKEKVMARLRKPGRKVIEITFEQMECFAGNALFVENTKGAAKMILSQTALNSLQDQQKTAILSKAEIISADIEIIETCGGGSVRCMLAEIFLLPTS